MIGLGASRKEDGDGTRKLGMEWSSCVLLNENGNQAMLSQVKTIPGCSFQVNS